VEIHKANRILVEIYKANRILVSTYKPHNRVYCSHLFADVGLGIYSGIFAMYLQCPLKEFRTAIIVFYVLCLLYVLSMATVVIDLLKIILEVSNNSIC
jgi:hypothetical protein